MKIIRDTANLPANPYPVVAIGNFDGVHLGHQALLKRTVSLAREHQGTAMVLTFEPHPLQIIAPERFKPLLTPFPMKMELLERYGIDQTVCLDFTPEFARQSAHDFVQNILARGLGARRVVVGFNYHFGRGREGNIDLLKRMGAECGYEVEVVPPVMLDGKRVSSSLVRALIEQGDVRAARRFLGREYSLRGPVVHGYKTGRGIGFPTANLDTSKVQIPAVGVYAVRVRIGNDQHHGVVNIGFNPTFERQRLSVEVHVLDFQEAIYEQEVEIAFVERIRGEIKFETAEKLIAQIKRDIETARSILESTPP